MYLIDTNIFLELLLNQSRANACEKFLNQLHKKCQPVIVTLFSIHSVVITLVSMKKWAEAQAFIQNIKNAGYIIVYCDDIEGHSETIKTCKETHLDFDDALQYFVAIQAHCKAIISYDHHFDGLTISRKTPEEVLV